MDKILNHIFRVTVDESRLVDVHGHKLSLLPSLSEELKDQGAPLKLTADVLDSAILEACSAIPHNKSIMDYLLPCFKRVVAAKKNMRVSTPQKDEVLAEARRLCMSYCIFALTMPDLFRYFYRVHGEP